MRGDANAVTAIIRTRSVRHLAVFTGNCGWQTLCGENRGPAAPWLGVRTLGLHFPSERLGVGIKEQPLCRDCRRVARRLASAIEQEDWTPPIPPTPPGTMGPTMIEAYRRGS